MLATAQLPHPLGLETCSRLVEMALVVVAEMIEYPSGPSTHRNIPPFGGL